MTEFKTRVKFGHLEHKHMMQSQIKDFYREWMRKVFAIDSQNESRHSFEKFIYLYIIYNALYCRATTCLKYYQITQNKKKEIDFNEGRTRKFQPTSITFDPDEKTQAVNNVIKFFDGEENLINFLQQGNAEHIQSIKNFNHGFYIYSLRKYGLKKSKENSLKLEEKLTSQLTKEQAEGILELIYHVRCNLFHGEKMFNPRQEDFLMPIVKILQSIVQELYIRLDDSNNLYYMDDGGYTIYLEEWKKQLQNKEIYSQLLESLEHDPSNLEIQENMRNIAKLAGYMIEKVNKDIAKFNVSF